MIEVGSEEMGSWVLRLAQSQRKSLSKRQRDVFLIIAQRITFIASFCIQEVRILVKVESI